MLGRLVLAFTFVGGGVAGASVLSPVTITDQLAAGRFYQEAQAQESFRALKDLNEIIYDRYIDRPWGDAYYPEADARWKKLRALVCPALTAFCRPPTDLTSPEQWLSTVLAFKTPAVQQELRERWASPVNGAPALYLNFGDLPQQVDARERFPVHSVIASGTELTATANYAGLGFFKRGIEVRETDYQYLSDLMSYRQGFGTAPGSVYFLVGARGPILLADRIKRKAEEFAARWKFLVEQGSDAPGEKLAQLDVLVARGMSARLKDVFLTKQTQLHTSLESLAAFEDDAAKARPESATAALARFDKEWLEFRWPEEVYQHVAYDLFRALNGELALYHFAANSERPKLNFRRRAWESLLDLQTKFDSTTVLYLLSLEMAFPENVILDQIADPTLARGYFAEQLKAVLEAGEFAGKPAYARFENLLLAPELRAEEFARAEAPEAWALIAGKDFGTLSAAERRAYFTALLFQGERLRPRVLFLMVSSMIQRGGHRLLKELALHVHATRIDEFKRND